MAIETDKLVHECAKLNARMAIRLSERGLEYLIWGSPTSCRIPENTNLWHPFYSRRSIFFKLCVYVYTVILYSVVGAWAFSFYKGFHYRLQRNNNRMLLIIPEEITDHTAELKTRYLIEDSSSPIDKLVFSRSKSIGTQFSSLTYRYKTIIFLKLLYHACKQNQYH